MKNTIALLLCSLAIFTAYAKANPFPGYYTQQTNDTFSEITLLPDQTFCYAFMGGSLDLMIAGHWQKNNDLSIDIKEHIQNMPAILLRPSKNEDNLKETKPKIHFSGHSLANDLSVVFGTSRNDLRPILSSDHNGFDEWYKMDISDKTKSVFIGHMSRDQKNTSTGFARYQIAEYDVDFSQFKVMNVYLNNDTYRRRLSATLALKNNILSTSGENYGLSFNRKKPLKSETLQKIKANCITPILTDAQAKVWAKPKQEFEIELPIKSMKPYFEKIKTSPHPKMVDVFLTVDKN